MDKITIEAAIEKYSYLVGRKFKHKNGSIVFMVTSVSYYSDYLCVSGYIRPMTVSDLLKYYEEI